MSGSLKTRLERLEKLIKPPPPPSPPDEAAERHHSLAHQAMMALLNGEDPPADTPPEYVKVAHDILSPYLCVFYRIFCDPPWEWNERFQAGANDTPEMVADRQRRLAEHHQGLAKAKAEELLAAEDMQAESNQWLVMQMAGYLIRLRALRAPVDEPYTELAERCLRVNKQRDWESWEAMLEERGRLREQRQFKSPAKTEESPITMSEPVSLPPEAVELQASARASLHRLLGTPNRAEAIHWAGKVRQLRDAGADPYQTGKYADLAAACLIYARDQSPLNWATIRQTIEHARTT